MVEAIDVGDYVIWAWGAPGTPEARNSLLRITRITKIYFLANFIKFKEDIPILGPQTYFFNKSELKHLTMIGKDITIDDYIELRLSGVL